MSSQQKFLRNVIVLALLFCASALAARFIDLRWLIASAFTGAAILALFLAYMNPASDEDAS